MACSWIYSRASSKERERPRVEDCCREAAIEAMVVLGAAQEMHECSLVTADANLELTATADSCGVSLAVMLTAAHVHVSKVFEELVHAG